MNFPTDLNPCGLVSIIYKGTVAVAVQSTRKIIVRLLKLFKLPTQMFGFRTGLCGAGAMRFQGINLIIVSQLCAVAGPLHTADCCNHR